MPQHRAQLKQFTIARQDLAVACEQTSTLGKTQNIRFSRATNGGTLLNVTWRDPRGKQAGVVINHGRVVKADE